MNVSLYIQLSLDLLKYEYTHTVLPLFGYLWVCILESVLLYICISAFVCVCLYMHVYSSWNAEERVFKTFKYTITVFQYLNYCLFCNYTLHVKFSHILWPDEIIDCYFHMYIVHWVKYLGKGQKSNMALCFLEFVYVMDI